MGNKRRRTNKNSNKLNNKDSKSKIKKSGKRVKNSNSTALVRKKDVKMKFKYKHPKLALTLKIFFIIFIILFVVGAGVVIGLFSGLMGEDFSIDIKELVLDDNSVIVDTDGNVLAELSGDENRKIISLDEMSPYLPNAYIAIEDERFETHHGVDIKRTGKAILSFITNFGKSTAGGGSTITQQVVKNVTKDDDTRGLDGVIRKLKEWVKAYQIEEVMSKDQILELYLNLIFVGGKENRGVEIGSQYYFNKSAKDLSIAECAFLAGINHSPNKYSPYKESEPVPIEKITKRTKTVLSQMKKLGYVTQEEYDTAIAEVDAGFKFENGAKGNVYSSHTDALISQLINQIMEEKQISKNAAETYLYSSGLKIYSTQVSSVQTVMEEEVKKDKYLVASKKTTNADGSPVYAQTAMVVIEPSTGYIVGCVGQIGEKTTSRGQNRATQSTRGTGSSIKPLATLVPGIEEGIVNAATIYDNTYTIFNQGTAQQFDPKNYNESHLGLRNVRYSTATSQNIPFVKIMAELGNAKCMEYLRKMGISTLDDTEDSGLSLALGGLYNGISPLEMAGAYASIANNGTYIKPTFYSKVEDADGKVVLEPNQPTERVCSEDTAYIVKDLLTSVVKDSVGTATYCKISGIDVAAKTGTTSDNYDRWLCGFTNYYAAATWFGYDEQEVVKYSGNPAGKIWDAVMTEIHKGLPNSKFEKTANIVTTKICRTSGLRATDKCTNTYSEVFIKGQLPKSCDAHDKQFTVCSESGKLPNEFCPTNKLETKQEKYIVEKERTKLWNTTKLSTTGETAPTEYCTIHKKVEVVKPEEPEKKPEQKPEENPEKDPDNENTEQKPENNTGNNNQKPNNNESTSGNTGNTGNIGSNGGTGNTGTTEQNKPQT